jgi:hypothetical protein
MVEKMAYEDKWNKISPSYLYPKKEYKSPLQLNNKQLAQAEEVKYLGIHLDRKLTWRKHISANRKQPYLKLRKLFWIIGRKSQLSLDNKLLVYKAILKFIWTNGVQPWGLASNSNLESLERFQLKLLWIVMDALWYVPNAVIKRDLQVLSVRHEVRNYSVTYRQRLDDQPNSLAKPLFQRPNYNPRLKRYYPADLATRF